MITLQTKIIFNADDFGYSSAVNYAILDCYHAGLVKSTTLMANMPGFDQAIQMAKDNPQLDVGVHLTLSCGKPLTSPKTLIVPETGNFKKISFYDHGHFEVDPDEVYRELKAQIDKIIAAGVMPSHFDSHQHTHTMGAIVEVVNRLADEYSVPVRNHDAVPGRHFVTEGFTMVMDDYSMKIAPDSYYNFRDQFVRDLQYEASQVKSIEVMTHPGYLDYFVFRNSSFREPRAIDASLLQDPVVIKAFTQPAFEVTSFKDIQEA